MAQRPTRNRNERSPHRGPASRRSPARRPRWDDEPRRRHPLGLLIVLLAGAGLAYTACAPRPPVPLKPGMEARHPPAPPPATETRRSPDPPKRADRAAPASPRPVPRQPVRAAPPRVVEVGPRPPAPRVAEVPGHASAPKFAEDQERAPAPKPAKRVTAADPKPALARRPVATPGEFSSNPAASSEVALTFDASYDDAPLASILSTLTERDCRATFFLTGEFARRYPEGVKRIAGAGMEIGNHSWSHPSFTKLSSADITRQLSRTNALLEQLSGQSPTLFRPPFGARDARVRRVVAEQGYETIYWALDSWDSVRKGITAKEIEQRVLSRVQPGDVVLLHIGSRPTADALPAIMRGLDERGLRVVPVSELMAIR